MTALTHNETTFMPAVHWDDEINLECAETGAEFYVNCGFQIEASEVSDDAVSGGAYYTEYTAKLVTAKFGRLTLMREDVIAMVGVETVQAADEFAASMQEVA